MKTANGKTVIAWGKNIPDSGFKLLNLLLLLVFLSGCGSLGGSSDGGSAAIADNSKVNALLSKAIRAEAKGEIEQAKNLYQQMIEAGAKSTKSLNHYAVFLRKQFEIDQAEAIYLKALKHSPRHANTHYNIAILYELYRGDFVKAKKHFELFQLNSSEPDKKVKAWIADLNRRIAAQQQSSS